MTVTCESCGRPVEVHATPEQVAAWRGGALIQEAMPDTPREEREILISGMCDLCFEALFPPENDS